MMKIDDVTRESLEQAVKILVSLTPLFAFWFISLGDSLLSLRIGVCAGIALLAVMALMRLTRGTMLWATGTFFVIAVLGAWLENLWVIRHLGTLASGILFVAVMLSMVLDRPFVLEYAREHTPPEQQESASFVRTCFVLTSFWAAVLLMMTVVSLIQLSYPGPGRTAYLLLQLAILITGLAYQVAYVVHVKHVRSATRNS